MVKNYTVTRTKVQQKKVKDMNPVFGIIGIVGFVFTVMLIGSQVL